MATYPFEPKSTRYLEPGQFWPIPLRNGQFGCGRVLRTIQLNGRVAPRLFHAGLMDWIGTAVPDSGALAGHFVVREALTHVKTIPLIRAQITGIRDLTLEGIVPSLWRKFSGSKGDCYVSINGADHLRPATAHERATLQDLHIWQGDLIVHEAERLLGVR